MAIDNFEAASGKTVRKQRLLEKSIIFSPSPDFS